MKKSPQTSAPLVPPRLAELIRQLANANEQVRRIKQQIAVALGMDADTEAVAAQALKLAQGGPITPTEVARELGLNHHSVRARMSELVQKGRLVRVRNGVYLAVPSEAA